MLSGNMNHVNTLLVFCINVSSTLYQKLYQLSVSMKAKCKAKNPSSPLDGRFTHSFIVFLTFALFNLCFLIEFIECCHLLSLLIFLFKILNKSFPNEINEKVSNFKCIIVSSRM